MLNSQAQDELWLQVQQTARQYQQRWLTGGACDTLPAILSSDNDTAALQALAVVSQLHLFEQTLPASALTPVATLPILALPSLPTRCRPAFRALLRDISVLPWASELLLQQLIAHGFTPHPQDWLPKPNDTVLPSTFLPWLCFVNGHECFELTNTSWSNLPHVLRIALLRHQRVHSPNAAALVLRNHLEHDNAERRLAYLALLQIGLSADDTHLLRQGLGDRSEKVRLLCRQLLWQLDIDNEDIESAPDEIADLTQWLRQERCGLLLTSKKIVAPIANNSVKTKQQLHALEQVGLPLIAKAFGITVEGFLQQWSFAENYGTAGYCPNLALLTNAARWLPSSAVMPLLLRLISQHIRTLSIQQLGLAPLFARLCSAQQLEAMQQLLQHMEPDYDLPQLISLAPLPWSFLTADTWQHQPLQRQLTSLLQQWQDTDQQAQIAPTLERFLRWLGLLVPNTTAQLIVQQALAAGIAPPSTMLETLNFQLSLLKGNHDE